MDTTHEFTVLDIWEARYFIKNAKAIFNKPLPTNPTARSEYDKFIQQPLRMLAYAHVLEIEKRSGKNYYSVANMDILDYIAQRERNTFNFLYCYLVKVLSDSGLLKYFDTYKNKCLQGNATAADFQELKDRYDKFTIGCTAINTNVEVHRIFPKVLNVYAVENQINGTEKGRMSQYAFTFSDLMYNRKNWRDLNKEKSITRQEAEQQQDIEQQEAYNAYYVQKAIFPQLAHYLENLIKLTATQHYTLAHPSNRTQQINRDYQLTCLLAKADTVETSLKTVGDKYYRKESFIFVINTGLDQNISLSTSFAALKNELIKIYNYV